MSIICKLFGCKIAFKEEKNLNEIDKALCPESQHRGYIIRGYCLRCKKHAIDIFGYCCINEDYLIRENEL